jgi:hypothetical protein
LLSRSPCRLTPNAARYRFSSLFFTLFPRTASQVGSIYFIFRLLKLHEKSSQESSLIKGGIIRFSIFGAAGKPKINKHFLTGAAVIRFALRKSMVKTVKNEKLFEPQASFFRLGFWH